MIEIYQAQNFILALPLDEKDEQKLSNIENLHGTHISPYSVRIEENTDQK